MKISTGGTSAMRVAVKRGLAVERACCDAADAGPLALRGSRPAGRAQYRLLAAKALQHGLTLGAQNVRTFMGIGVGLVDPWNT